MVTLQDSTLLHLLEIERLFLQKQAQVKLTNSLDNNHVKISYWQTRKTRLKVSFVLIFTCKGRPFLLSYQQYCILMYCIIGCVKRLWFGHYCQNSKRSVKNKCYSICRKQKVLCMNALAKSKPKLHLNTTKYMREE